jgi:hypothetical protein
MGVDEDPAEIARADLDDRTALVVGEGGRGQHGSRQREGGNHENAGETHAINFLRLNVFRYAA